ncbi:hypothetical protein DSL72_009094 [Monilinia vaccinii-corymbosi]|uniref:NAD(P)H-hydrate epimerase n=1 Tax=Monilinia vaccinii-corymbosi TaxID=61207 RepID=A0A8A3PNE2_9HELO|nr:hypothetical protein DSL72_009094 [Monilinia vaccinii-corymbosi]
MAAKYLSAANAAALDKDLMSRGAFSLDQLMELAGLSVSQVGGDGLVAARHLWHYGYKPTIYYPKQGKNELYQRLSTQLRNLSISFTDDFPSALRETDHIVDAIFGFSFSGTLRDPFPSIITALSESSLPITSIDAPSSWDITNGPPPSGPGANFMPQYLISLTAPKPLVKHFKGRHFLGGRFVTPEIAEKYNLQLPAYEGIDQIVEMPMEEEESGGKP